MMQLGVAAIGTGDASECRMAWEGHNHWGSQEFQAAGEICSSDAGYAGVECKRGRLEAVRDAANTAISGGRKRCKWKSSGNAIVVVVQEVGWAGLLSFNNEYRCLHD